MTDDDLFPKLVARWGEGQDYHPSEFVVDRSSTVEALSGKFRAFDDRVVQAKDRLERVSTARWTGPAATAFAAYKTAMRGYLTSVSGALTAATGACGRPVLEMDAAWIDATNAAKQCNQARRDKVVADRAFETWYMRVNQPNFHKNPQDDLDEANARRAKSAAEADMTAGLAKATAARQRNRDALDLMIAGLDGPDSALANLAVPKPPDPATITDPTERALLQALVAPIAKALAGAGDTARAQGAKAAWEQAMKADPTGRQAKALLATWAKQLTGAELDWVLNHVDENHLGTALGTFDPNTDRELYNAIAAKAGLDVLARLADTDPNHYWHPATGGPYRWDSTGAKPGQVPPADLGLLSQGLLGDCYWLSSVAAVESQHPGFLADHVKANRNGTYTVTLYRDGKPVQITVTPEVPMAFDADGVLGPAYAGGSANIFQLYEKAMAQAQGELKPEPGVGYAGMEGGVPSNYLPVLTGHPAETVATSDVTPQQLKTAFDSGKPIVWSTRNDTPGDGLFNADGEVVLIPGHAYYVDAVDTESDPPTVTVVNPWGRDSERDGRITLYWNGFDSHSYWTAFGR